MSPARTVKDQLRIVTVTTPANTLQAAPLTTSWNLGPVIVKQVEIMVPAGHSGLTGIHVDYDGVALVPWGQPPVFLQADGETITVPVDFEVGHPLSVVTYNTDRFPHAHYLRAVVDVWLAGATRTGSVTILPIVAAADGGFG